MKNLAAVESIVRYLSLNRISDLVNLKVYYLYIYDFAKSASYFTLAYMPIYSFDKI